MGACVSSKNSGAKVKPDSKQVNSEEDLDRAVKKLQRENPFLAAIMHLTKNKTSHLNNSMLNASTLMEPKINPSDFKGFNTYEKDLDFYQLLLTYSKKYLNWSEIKETLGDCRKDAWFLALVKYAFKFLGEVNFMMKFGEYTNIDYMQPNIWDKEIDEAVALLNNDKGDRSLIAWTNQFESNLILMLYYNITDTEAYDSLAYKNFNKDQTDWKESVFGPEDWNEYFGIDVSGEENSALPAEIEEAMNADGTIFTGSEDCKVFHTHTLTYIPKKLGEVILSLHNLQVLLAGNQHSSMEEKILELDMAEVKDWAKEEELNGGYWCLMSKDVFPKTKSHLIEVITTGDPEVNKLRYNEELETCE